MSSSLLKQRKNKAKEEPKETSSPAAAPSSSQAASADVNKKGPKKTLSPAPSSSSSSNRGVTLLLFCIFAVASFAGGILLFFIYPKKSSSQAATPGVIYNSLLLPIQPYPTPNKDLAAPGDIGMQIFDAANRGKLQVLLPLAKQWAGNAVISYKSTNKDDYGYTPLHQAVYENKFDCFRVLLMAGANISATTNDGFTPLHTAARFGRAGMTLLLIQQGADANAVTIADRKTPLHLAATSSEVVTSAETIRVLLKEGKADVFARMKEDKDGVGKTALMIATKAIRFDEKAQKAKEEIVDVLTRAEAAAIEAASVTATIAEATATPEAAASGLL